MADSLTKIDPGLGLGLIRFGMLAEDVEKLLGPPDEILTSDEDDEGEEINTRTYVYNEPHLLELNFDGDEEDKLISILIENPEAELFGEELIGKTEEDARAAVLQAGHEVEIWEGPDLRELSIEDLEITLWVEQNLVYAIEWGPFWEDEETIQWPE